MFPQETIQTHIMQYVSQGRRGPKPVAARWELVNAILYKHKAGCRWYMLPVKSLIFSLEIPHKTVYHHFRNWVTDGSWMCAWQSLTREFKRLLDLST